MRAELKTIERLNIFVEEGQYDIDMREWDN